MQTKQLIAETDPALRMLGGGGRGGGGGGGGGEEEEEESQKRGTFLRQLVESAPIGIFFISFFLFLY